MSVLALCAPESFNQAMKQACLERQLDYIVADAINDVSRSEQSACDLLFLDISLLDQLSDILPLLDSTVIWVLLGTDPEVADKAVFDLGAVEMFDPSNLGAIARLLVRCLRFSRLQKQYADEHEQLLKARADLQLNNDQLRQDQLAGRKVQQRMLPETPWQLGNALIEHQVIPSLYLSGDYVEYLKLHDNKVLLLIADVSGHGSSSAFITVLLKNQMARVRMIIDQNHHDVMPHWVLENINNELLAMGLDKHVTAVAAVLDLQANTLTWSVAGHLPGPLLTLQKDDGLDCSFLPGEGFPLGLFESANYQSQSASLTEHFSLSLFSDGVLELGSKGDDLASKEAYLLALQNERIFSLQDWQRELGLRSVSDPSDDITLLIVSR